MTCALAHVESETKELASKVDQVEKEKAASTQPLELVPQWYTYALFGLQLCPSRSMHHTAVLAELFVPAALAQSNLACVY